MLAHAETRTQVQDDTYDVSPNSPPPASFNLAEHPSVTLQMAILYPPLSLSLCFYSLLLPSFSASYIQIWLHLRASLSLACITFSMVFVGSLTFINNRFIHSLLQHLKAPENPVLMLQRQRYKDAARIFCEPIKRAWIKSSKPWQEPTTYPNQLLPHLNSCSLSCCISLHFLPLSNST